MFYSKNLGLSCCLCFYVIGEFNEDLFVVVSRNGIVVSGHVRRTEEQQWGEQNQYFVVDFALARNDGYNTSALKYA